MNINFHSSSDEKKLFRHLAEENWKGTTNSTDSWWTHNRLMQKCSGHLPAGSDRPWQRWRPSPGRRRCGIVRAPNRRWDGPCRLPSAGQCELAAGSGASNSRRSAYKNQKWKAFGNRKFCGWICHIERKGGGQSRWRIYGVLLWFKG